MLRDKDYYNINGTRKEGTEEINRNRVTRGDENGSAELLTTTSNSCVCV